MQARTLTAISAVLVAAALSIHLAGRPLANRAELAGAEDGIVRVRSAYALPETVERLKSDVASKGIMLFSVVDQAKLAADAGIKLQPSTLLLFGNPALGAQFITSKSQAGLDWPVRLLVHQDDKGQVWATYSDFSWIARRHRITDRDAAFKTAAGVVASITSSVAGR